MVAMAPASLTSDKQLRQLSKRTLNLDVKLGALLRQPTKSGPELAHRSRLGVGARVHGWAFVCGSTILAPV